MIKDGYVHDPLPCPEEAGESVIVRIDADVHLNEDRVLDLNPDWGFAWESVQDRQQRLKRVGVCPFGQSDYKDSGHSVPLSSSRPAPSSTENGVSLLTGCTQKRMPLSPTLLPRIRFSPVSILVGSTTSSTTITSSWGRLVIRSRTGPRNHVSCEAP